jgi:transcriptional regulator with XRE-family HTH domain
VTSLASRDATCQVGRHYLFAATCDKVRHVTRRDVLARLKKLPLHERIRFLRNQRGLSHDAYAKLIGGKLTRGRIIAWERAPGVKGQSYISDEYAARLAELENLPLDLFLAPNRQGVDVERALETRLAKIEAEQRRLSSELETLRAPQPDREADPGEPT